MRIAFFVPEYPPRVLSGLGRYAENICRAIRNQGHEITVFTMNDGTLKTSELLDGVAVHRPLLVDGGTIFPEVLTMQHLLRLSTGTRYFNDVLIYNILSASKFVNEVIRKKGQSFDIICAHNWQSAIAGIIAKEETGLPFVFHLHSIEEDRMALREATLIRYFEERAADRADRVVTDCYPLHEYLALHGFDTRKLQVCWNAVNVERYDPAKLSDEAIGALRKRYGIDRDETMLIFEGELEQTADLVNLVAAMRIVAQKHPEVKLVILGRGEGEHRIAELIAEWGLEERVKTRFELVTEAERILHYGAADTIVCPSLRGPCSILSLEAMAMKKPVILGAKGFCSICDHLVTSGRAQTGVLADGSDPHELAWAILRLLEDKAGAAEMGDRGRRRVATYRSWDEIAAYTLAIYEDTIRAARAGEELAHEASI
jgi:glycogen(starch) synthase